MSDFWCTRKKNSPRQRCHFLFDFTSFAKGSEMNLSEICIAYSASKSMFLFQLFKRIWPTRSTHNRYLNLFDSVPYSEKLMGRPPNHLFQFSKTLPCRDFWDVLRGKPGSRTRRCELLLQGETPPASAKTRAVAASQTRSQPQPASSQDAASTEAVCSGTKFSFLHISSDCPGEELREETAILPASDQPSPCLRSRSLGSNAQPEEEVKRKTVVFNRKKKINLSKYFTHLFVTVQYQYESFLLLFAISLWNRKEHKRCGLNNYPNKEDMTWQDKTRQDKTRQDKTRQDIHFKVCFYDTI